MRGPARCHGASTQAGELGGTVWLCLTCARVPLCAGEGEAKAEGH